ncbi:hypothetical protein A2334_05325 [Candidatus Roizmanbacteria bacterium RIFOXYB2_FULL_38_10]|uniref:DNA polymerase III delta N-terminal domain-containing protein n=1 Tax=Candidatus Roizmanbacteria bacterium RIFOXYD1_FULL_38_12 TaxID=1802093 RepID=A0A1F7L0Q0_9BACT|nr:MAG: hypothetical protein A3K47_02445 [Candidatus Roizmanbacteria bacterium RIFOXYA2_FULL_38_14]OGK63631.1 MAG: hypothetical protein A3K27_02445 [Candidatus Roizmanbacteria bacterium RIFOXYA1_FULL_37_12]OGK65477.1 MAG: hypothetical protein A3K38_02445 [Candidatus Roizmanbacteria bacterium RIFOXYB1_FULL_40_23]OGK68262.1 MAG: hypothetical protein A2334_05325 [Candidatus Roizmanbacteria bacterium RIFOXYB2_FULL_38_10]OGK69882.1 MAG: hypothetical protein A3K21_02450 [Candidatus Roizmanbacteria ba
MLIIICGEDTVTSRNFFANIKNDFTKKNIEVKDITAQSIPELLSWSADNLSLFSDKKVFFTEHLEASIIRKRGKKNEDVVTTIANRKDIEFYDWEEKSGRDIKLKDIAQIKEFKPHDSIFKLLESCYPGNRNVFVQLLQTICDSHDATFIFIMIYRHIRSLILAYERIFSPRQQSWQQHKLHSQAARWSQNILVKFYEGLYRIESSTKSGNNPYGVKKSLEILACYYL